MNPQTVSIQLTAASANAIALTQAVGAGAAVNLNGASAANGIATLDRARRVSILSAGNDAGVVWTVTGTNAANATISETVQGANAVAVATQQDFKTVTRITASAATAGTMQAGTNGVASSSWQMLARDIVPFQMSIAVVVTGTVNYTVEYTYDDPNTSPGGDIGAWPGNQSQIPTPYQIAALTAQTANKDISLGAPSFGPPWGWRLLLNSGAGLVRATAVQAGIKTGGL